MSHISADAFSGALWALDGIKDGMVIINGPTGCKFYHASISNSQLCRGTSYNPGTIDEEFYFRQNRIPCTYLDGNDFIYGAEEKLRKALKKVLEDKPTFIALVNSPGAALIGDDLEGILKDEVSDIPFVAIENSGFSDSYYNGFQKAAIALLNKLKLERTEVVPKTVNLFGFSIYQKHYEGNIDELKRLLALSGVEVICTPFCACTFDEMIKSSSAVANIVVAPEAGGEIAQWYEENVSIPTVTVATPIGFDATEAFVKAVCEMCSVSPQPALHDIKYSRAVSFRHLQAFNSLSGYPKGTGYAVKGDFSLVRGLFNFLTPYLGMLPVALECIDEDESLLAVLNEELSQRGMDDVSSKIEGNYHMLFADGNTIAQEKAIQKVFTGVEVALPSLGYTDVIPKPVMGAQGALYIIEQVINGLKFFCK